MLATHCLLHQLTHSGYMLATRCFLHQSQLRSQSSPHPVREPARQQVPPKHTPQLPHCCLTHSPLPSSSLQLIPAPPLQHGKKTLHEPAQPKLRGNIGLLGVSLLRVSLLGVSLLTVLSKLLRSVCSANSSANLANSSGSISVHSADQHFRGEA